MKKNSVPCLIGAVLALFVFLAFPSSAQATDPVYFQTVYGTGTNLYVKMTCTTPGAIIFFTISSADYPDDPTHTGDTANPGTIRYWGQVPIPYWQTRWFAAVAWTPSEGDSQIVEYWFQPNPNY
jgi:hypothetical protein